MDDFLDFFVDDAAFGAADGTGRFKLGLQETTFIGSFFVVVGIGFVFG